MELSQNKPSSTYYPALTGVRALAALSVVGFHLLYGAESDVLGLGSIFGGGELGVAIFFALSGFILCHANAQVLHEKRITLMRFYWKRFARIYPVYFFLLVATYLWQWRQGMIPSAGQIAANLTLTQSYVLPWLYSGIAPAWSLGVEEAFYLVFPLLVPVVLGTRSLKAKVCLLTVIALSLFALGMGIKIASAGRGGFLATDSLLILSTIFGRFIEFAFGILAWIWWRRSTLSSGDFVRRDIIATLCFAVILGLSVLRSLSDPTTQMRVLTNLAAALAASLMFVSLVSGRSWLRSLFIWRPIEYLGKISYSLYLVHAIDLSAIKALYHKLGLAKALTTDAALYLPFGMLVSVVAAMAAYHMVERPAHRWLRRRFKG